MMRKFGKGSTTWKWDGRPTCKGCGQQVTLPHNCRNLESQPAAANSSSTGEIEIDFDDIGEEPKQFGGAEADRRIIDAMGEASPEFDPDRVAQELAKNQETIRELRDALDTAGIEIAALVRDRSAAKDLDVFAEILEVVLQAESEELDAIRIAAQHIARDSEIALEQEPDQKSSEAKVESGRHLGAVRNWIKWNCSNGDRVTWGSADVLGREFTVQDIEEIAQRVADAVKGGE